MSHTATTRAICEWCRWHEDCSRRGVEVRKAVWIPVLKSQAAPDPYGVLHRRFIEGDSAAFDLLAEKMLPDLTRRLAARFRQLGPDVGQAAVDALLDYWNRPTRFDPTRASIGTYLYQIAWRRAVDIRRSEIHRRRREL